MMSSFECVRVPLPSTTRESQHSEHCSFIDLMTYPPENTIKTVYAHLLVCSYCRFGTKKVSIFAHLMQL